MRGRGQMFTGKNDRYNAVRISPRFPHFIEVRYESGKWCEEWGSGGTDIVALEWQDNDWVDAVLADGRKVHAVLLRP